MLVEEQLTAVDLKVVNLAIQTNRLAPRICNFTLA